MKLLIKGITSIMNQQDAVGDEAQTESVEDLEVTDHESEETKAGDSTRNGNLQIPQFYHGTY